MSHALSLVTRKSSYQPIIYKELKVGPFRTPIIKPHTLTILYCTTKLHTLSFNKEHGQMVAYAYIHCGYYLYAVGLMVEFGYTSSKPYTCVCSCYNCYL